MSGSSGDHVRYLYLGVFVILIAVLIARMPAAVRNRESWMTWLAVLLACLAIMTLGPVIPIEVLDSWLGGTNVVWLVQCVLATFAFWAFAEAAKAIDGIGAHPLRTIAVPILGCALFTLPFFFSRNRGTTVEHFSRVHAYDFAIFLSALIYMAGLCWIVGGIVRASRGHDAPGHRLFRTGGLAIIAGCVIEAITMTMDHLRLGNPAMVQIAYWGFDVLFYPGVILIASGMGYFSIRRVSRTRRIRRRADGLRKIITRTGLPTLDDEIGHPADTYTVYALLIRINDHRILGNITLTPSDAALIADSEIWVEADLPQMIEAAG